MAAQHRRRARQCADLAGGARFAAEPGATPLARGARACALGAGATPVTGTTPVNTGRRSAPVNCRSIGGRSSAPPSAIPSAALCASLAGGQQAAADRIEEMPAAPLLADLGEQLLIVVIVVHR